MMSYDSMTLAIIFLMFPVMSYDTMTLAYCIPNVSCDVI